MRYCLLHRGTRCAGPGCGLAAWLTLSSATGRPSCCMWATFSSMRAFIAVSRTMLMYTVGGHVSATQQAPTTAGCDRRAPCSRLTKHTTAGDARCTGPVAAGQCATGARTFEFINRPRLGLNAQHFRQNAIKLHGQSRGVVGKHAYWARTQAGSAPAHLPIATRGCQPGLDKGRRGHV